MKERRVAAFRVSIFKTRTLPQPEECDVTESVTDLLRLASEGDAEASSRLWATMYDSLREIAAEALRKEHGHRPVQATELVHEAYLRVISGSELTFENRNHFLATTARVIRHLLIDQARQRKSQKRGGEGRSLSLESLQLSAEQDLLELVDLDQALTELAGLDERQSKLVELRFFGGLTMKQAADALGVSERTAADDWAFARAWLRRKLGDIIT